jgi:C-terminal processing protease CtpA/Prc
MHGAERVGDASLYSPCVSESCGAAGIKNGDEVVTVSSAVIGKHGQVVQTVRGQVGTEVKLGVRRGEEVREIAITRVAAEKLYKR